MWGIPYDDLSTWGGVYPADVFASQFDKLAEGWRSGVAELQTAVDHAPAERRDEVTADLRFARAAGIHFQSVANQARFVIARDKLANASAALSADERGRLRAEIERCAQAEIGLARELFPLIGQDSRIGYEPTCQYFYLPLDLVEKVVNCQWLLEQSGDPAQ